jgi:hypothetical protein
MQYEMFWRGQWIVTSRIGAHVIAIVLCGDYGQALEAFCELQGVG